ncbi:MAG: LacI family DNA-binding transcriptional regulator [Oscillospiraceae bacterium]|nr:LacI family DNA-binding transcriptional regulator [Oscillospiraceae bacterium]
MPTIQDVAKAAGVSIATVSRVINSPATVSVDKVKRVKSAIDELNYYPNSSGRNLRRSATKTLLMICAATISDVLDGAYEAAARQGYRIVATYADRRQLAKGMSYFNELFMGNVDGAILFSALRSDENLAKLCQTVPIVQCSSFLDLPNASSVSTDEEAAAYDAVTHLLETGKRRIGLITQENLPGAEDSYYIRRERGYCRALADAGIPIRQEMIFRTPGGVKNGYYAGKQLLKDKADGIFGVQDTFAYGALVAAQRMGLSIPEQVGIVGIDNTGISQLSDPGLTTVQQSFYEMGQVAVNMLIEQIRGEMDVKRNVYLQHRLLVRGSTVRGRSDGEEEGAR